MFPCRKARAPFMKSSLTLFFPLCVCARTCMHVDTLSDCPRYSIHRSIVYVYLGIKSPCCHRPVLCFFVHSCEPETLPHHSSNSSILLPTIKLSRECYAPRLRRTVPVAATLQVEAHAKICKMARSSPPLRNPKLIIKKVSILNAVIRVFYESPPKVEWQ